MDVLFHVLLNHIYLNISLIQNYISSESLSSTVSQAHIPPIEKYWGYFAMKYGGELLKRYHHMSAKQTLKRHVQKLKRNVFGVKSFLQQCILTH